MVMKEKSISIPEIGLLAGTRVALGVGLGLIIADRISPAARKGAGAALLAVGALSTIPIVMDILTKPSANDKGQPTKDRELLN
jgi:hypothetical protein